MPIQPSLHALEQWRRSRSRFAAALLVATFRKWRQDKPRQWAAALSYYAIFSIAPILLLSVSVAGFFLKREEAQQRLVDQLGEWIGPTSAASLDELITRLNPPSSHLGVNLLATGLLLFGAAQGFSLLQEALNAIWLDQEARRGGIKAGMVRRLRNFLMVVFSGLLVLALMLANVSLRAVQERFGEFIPGIRLYQLLSFAILLSVVTMLFAAIYKWLPLVRIDWREVWVGALFTATILIAGQYLVSLYFIHSRVGAAYVAAGSIVASLFWLYCSAHIVLIGAEFTSVYATIREQMIGTDG